MRVIAGTARSLPLKTLDGLDTRPTTDRIKETLFNILMPYLYDCRFLDLFAGSGGIGIEALSRGARSCVFAENNRKAVACINDNLAFTKFTDKAVVYPADVFSVLAQLEGQEPFTIIFMDPPYRKELEAQALRQLVGVSYVDADTLIVVEAALETDFSYAETIGFTVIREKCYKTNKHVFLQKQEA